MKVPVEIKNKLPSFPNFESISFDNQELLNWFFSNYKQVISEYTFTNLFAWRHSRPILLSLLDGWLCIMAQEKDGSKYFLPPVGSGDLFEVCMSLIEYAHRNGFKARIERVPEEMAMKLSEHGLSISYDKDNSDYVYLVDQLADLPGRKYDGKRNRIKKCVVENDPEYVPITEEVVEACLNLQSDWCDLRHCELDPGLSAEDMAIKEVLNHISKLPVFGCMIMIKGKIEAFTLAERLNQDTAVIHFEKANPTIDGLYQLINQWFCQRALKGNYLYVNREQDLGIEGLRRAKESYYPDHMVNKYIVWKEE